MAIFALVILVIFLGISLIALMYYMGIVREKDLKIEELEKCILLKKEQIASLDEKIYTLMEQKYARKNKSERLLERGISMKLKDFFVDETYTIGVFHEPKYGFYETVCLETDVPRSLFVALYKLFLGAESEHIKREYDFGMMFDEIVDLGDEFQEFVDSVEEWTITKKEAEMVNKFLEECLDDACDFEDSEYDAEADPNGELRDIIDSKDLSIIFDKAQ